MAFGSVTLQPGINVERTPMLLRAGYSSSSLIRWRDSLAQKYGGWARYFPSNLTGVPRDLHAWLDLNQTGHLAVGTTGTGTQLGIITNGAYQDITPQTLTSNFAPNISTTASSPIVSIIDPNIANVTTFDSVFFDVPISIGGLILDGLYPITEITGTDSYEITAGTNATTTCTNPTSTNGSTASGNNTLHFASTPTWIVAGMVVADLTTPSAIPAGTTVLSTTGTTVVMSSNAAGAGVGNGDSIVFASVPVFTTSSGSSEVSVKFINHGTNASGVDKVVFDIPTSVGGLTIKGNYSVIGVADVNDFTINANTSATSTAAAAMNSGNAQLVYYIALGPLPPGAGYGLGGYGDGGYGLGQSGGSQQTGTEITATDWTSDNWGEILLACPQGGGLYYYDPTGGFQNAQIISTDPESPPFNTGLFVSSSEQILVAYGSSVHQAIGWQYDPLLVQWSDVSNFFTWTPTETNQAGNFRLPFGSKVEAGTAAPNQNLIWTDLDLWAMNYIGFPDVFGFNQIGAGMGAVSGHAVQKLRGGIYWMAQTNFCAYIGGSPVVLPCSVWDAVFQNLNTNFLQNVRAMPNTPFNEVGWQFPSVNSTSGECDSFVKMNITEANQPWDVSIGTMGRSAWIDEGVLGNPIGATSNGVIFQHETTADANGQPLVSTFTTGLFYLEEGENFVVVDQIIPDFKWATFGGGGSAQIQLSFNMYNYPGDTPTTYGPFTVTMSTEYIFQRMRGRLMSVTVASADIGSFWRLGSIKFRYAPAGRR